MSYSSMRVALLVTALAASCLLAANARPLVFGSGSLDSLTNAANSGLNGLGGSLQDLAKGGNAGDPNAKATGGPLDGLIGGLAGTLAGGSGSGTTQNTAGAGPGPLTGDQGTLPEVINGLLGGLQGLNKDGGQGTVLGNPSNPSSGLTGLPLPKADGAGGLAGGAGGLPRKDAPDSGPGFGNLPLPKDANLGALPDVVKAAIALGNAAALMGQKADGADSLPLGPQSGSSLGNVLDVLGGQGQVQLPQGGGPINVQLPGDTLSRVGGAAGALRDALGGVAGAVGDASGGLDRLRDLANGQAGMDEQTRQRADQTFQDLSDALALISDGADSTGGLLDMLETVTSNPLLGSALDALLGQRFTLFAPIDGAVTAYLEAQGVSMDDLGEALQQAPELLTRLLAPHVVPYRRILSADMGDGDRLRTGIPLLLAPGARLVVQREGDAISLQGPKNTVKVLVPDLVISMGEKQAVVHIIDGTIQI